MMNAKTEFRDLLKNSVIAGIPQIIGVKEPLRKFLRLAVLLCCLTGFMYQTSRFLKIYWSYPTIMDLEVSFPDEVEVPAVSVCSYNGIKASVFCERFPTLCTPLKNLSDLCNTGKYFCNANAAVGDQPLPAVKPHQLPPLKRSEFRDMGIRMEDLIEECTIMSSTKLLPCSQDIKWVSTFDAMGLPNNCYVLNSLWGNRSGNALRVKAKAHMVLLITAETTDHFYTGTAHAIRISLHNPHINVNPFKEGFPVQPCTNYYVYISKVVHLLLPPPYSTNCTDYVRKWQARGGRGPLNKRQCREECILNASVLQEQCVDSFYVTYPNTEKICNRSFVDNNRLFRKCSHACSRACISEEMKLEIEEHSRLDDKANRKRSNECLSVIVFAFSRMKQTTFRYVPKYESVELFSYIGGYMGIWLGISLIAVSDILESLLIIFKYVTSKIKRTLTAKRTKLDHPFSSHPKIRIKVRRTANTLQIF